MELRFSDGSRFDTSGEYRVVKRADGYYVLGHGMMCPVDSREEGLSLIQDLRKECEK